MRLARTLWPVLRCVCVCVRLTLGQVRGQVRHLLSADVCPVEVVVRILLVVTLSWAVIEAAAAYKRQTLHMKQLKHKGTTLSVQHY